MLEPLTAFAPAHWHQGYARESLRPFEEQRPSYRMRTYRLDRAYSPR